MKGYKVTPDELDQSSEHLANFGDRIDEHNTRVQSAHENLSTHVSGDKSGLGQVFKKFASKAGTAFSDMGKQVSRVVKGSGSRLKTSSKAYKDNESNVKQKLDGIGTKRDETKGPTKPVDTSRPSSSGGTKPSSASVHEPPKLDKGKGVDTGPAGAKPALSTNKPPSAGSEFSDKFTAKPQLDEPTPYSKPLPSAGTDSYHMPPDRTRGAKVTQLDESQVVRGKDGLITHVKVGEPPNQVHQPIKDYVGDLAKQRAQIASKPQQYWKDQHPGQTPPKGLNNVGKEGRCSAVAVDLKTGLVTQGVNGKDTQVIPESNLHPLLQQNLQDLRAYKHPVLANQHGDLAETKHSNGVYDGQAHYSNPAQHAEVKAVNELLWQRQAAGEAQHGPGYQLPPSTLNEMRFDPRWTAKTGDAGVGDSAAACANCNTILNGVPCYSGRCQYDTSDYRYGNPNVPPHKD